MKRVKWWPIQFSLPTLIGHQTKTSALRHVSALALKSNKSVFTVRHGTYFCFHQAARLFDTFGLQQTQAHGWNLTQTFFGWFVSFLFYDIKRVVEKLGLWNTFCHSLWVVVNRWSRCLFPLLSTPNPWLCLLFQIFSTKHGWHAPTVSSLSSSSPPPWCWCCFILTAFQPFYSPLHALCRRQPQTIQLDFPQ